MSSEINHQKLDKPYVIKWAITIILPLLIAMIPANGAYTMTIRLFLIITLAAILCIAFELLDLIIPSIFLPTFYILSGVSTPQVAYGSWMTTTPWCILGAYVLANVLDETGLLKRVSYWCILKTGGSYQSLLYGIMTAGILISLLSSGMGKMIIAVLCVGICKTFELKVSRESAVIMLVGAISTITPALFVYNPIGLAVLLGSARTVLPNLTISWMDYFVSNFLYIFFMYFFLWVMIKFFKPSLEIDGKTYFSSEYERLGRVSVAEKKSLLIVAFLLLFLLTGKLHHMDINYGFIIIPFLLFFPGINIGSQKAITSLPYSMIIFAVACVGIGDVAGSIGLAALISGNIQPILSHFGTTGVLMLVSLMGFVLNMLLTPLAIMGAFGGPITQIALDLGINPLGALYALKCSMDQILFPYEYIPYLIFFSFGYIPMKEFIKIMGLKTLLQFVFLFACLIPYWHLIGVL